MLTSPQTWSESLKAEPLYRRSEAGTAVIMSERRAQHCWDKGRWWWKHEVSGAGWGGDSRGGGGGWRVPELPASDDQSVHQPGLTGAHWNSSAGRTKKHPPWESAFSPARRRVMDWAGRCTQCICEERLRGEERGGGQGLSEKHFHFTPRMH